VNDSGQNVHDDDLDVLQSLVAEVVGNLQPCRRARGDSEIALLVRFTAGRQAIRSVSLIELQDDSLGIRGFGGFQGRQGVLLGFLKEMNSTGVGEIPFRRLLQTGIRPHSAATVNQRLKLIADNGGTVSLGIHCPGR
jgi:hypothetical protein